MIGALAQLLSPHDPKQLEQAIERNERLHLHTNQAAEFAELLPWPMVNGLITTDLLVAGRIVAVRQGMSVPLDLLAPLNRSRGERELRAEALQDLCRQGISLVINKIGNLAPAIGRMDRLVERHLRTRAFTNAYVSFARDSAFGAHWDDHNVLVLQVAGRKRWWCYGQPHRFPVASPKFPSPGPVDLNRPVWEAVMEPGDVLFIPRGDVHRAEVLGDASIHLTVGLTPPRGADVLRWLAQKSLDEEFGRQDIHPLSTAEALARRAETLRAEFHRLVDGLDLSEFFADQDRNREAKPAPNIGLSSNIGAETRVLPALRRRMPLPEPTSKGAVIHAGGRRFTLSATELAIFALVDARGYASVAELGAEVRDAENAVSALARMGLVQLENGDA
jgi:hypothetical protein